MEVMEMEEAETEEEVVEGRGAAEAKTEEVEGGETFKTVRDSTKQVVSMLPPPDTIVKSVPRSITSGGGGLGRGGDGMSGCGEVTVGADVGDRVGDRVSRLSDSQNQPQKRTPVDGGEYTTESTVTMPRLICVMTT
ncbi:hypothetical protein CYMTET_4330 [Cymbomonas tetramitiformis]|uniref:Uncharacterized protein n=1 Tax=Cymbomonas tetramitiformis TaxID=36881 RepID=A0AAE0H1T5_9CHLO|nr:hypothetical protein CYMTET_4330 [Cymbomonas tetramitiformis]